MITSKTTQETPQNVSVNNIDNINKYYKDNIVAPDINVLGLDESFHQVIKEIYNFYKKIIDEESIKIPDYKPYIKNHLDRNAEKLYQIIRDKNNKYETFLKSSQNFAEFIITGLNTYISTFSNELQAIYKESEKWEEAKHKGLYWNLSVWKEDKYFKSLFKSQLTTINKMMKDIYLELNGQKEKMNKDINLLKEGSFFEKIAIYTGFKRIGDLVDFDSKSYTYINNKNNNKKVDIEFINNVLNDKINEIKSYYTTIINEKMYSAVNPRNEVKDKYFNKLIFFKTEYNKILNIRINFAEFVYKGLESYKEEAQKQIKNINEIDSKNINSEIHSIVDDYRNQIKIIRLLLEVELEDLNKRKKNINDIEEILRSKGLSRVINIIKYLL